MNILPLASPLATLETTGGKGANLARLARAGFPVPDGFLISTAAYRQFVQENSLASAIDPAIDSLDTADPVALETASTRIRAAFSAGTLSPALAQEIQTAYKSLNQESKIEDRMPVAVRSSATAEDLPDLSFAGQQDTYLNIVGFDALCAAVIQCWGSLWTARAIGYRARNNIPHKEVALSVVVQQMVQSEASGVLFTANPLTGRRTETVIDATFGLGEALVSGLVEPDHYLVTNGGLILEKNLGAKATLITSRTEGGTVTEQRLAADLQAIPDDVILALTQLGQCVAAEYDFPQDIEWAWTNGQLYLLQARPITSLYPLPEGMSPDPLRAMMALSSVQGVMEPLTPLGLDTLIHVLSGGRKIFGLPIDPATQHVLLNAGERMYLDVTSILSNPLGRKILPRGAVNIDPGVSQAFLEIVKDPRMAPKSKGLRLQTIRRLLRFLLPTLGRIRRVWHDPAACRTEVFRIMDVAVAEAEARVTPTGEVWTDFANQLALLRASQIIFPDVVVPYGVTAVVAGMVPFFGILQNFANRTGNPDLKTIPLEIARGLPYNVTTEMDLALWHTAQTLRAQTDVFTLFTSTPATDLAHRYLAGTLPPAAQQPLAAFLTQYGMRGLGEIDLGRPRWGEDPEHIIQVLQGYLKIEDPALAPDVVFARGEKAAEAAAERLIAAVRQQPFGGVRARLVQWAVTRYRAVGGLREAPKFFAIRMMGVIRQSLLASGRSLTEMGLLHEPDDLFFLTIRELHTIDAQKTVPDVLRTRIAERRALRAREMRRKQLPRVLLSDGTAYYEGLRNEAGDSATIHGSPVSPGVVEGIVHIVHNPLGAHLTPGEILVCPGTDPAWTPLFLSAGGLVMEVGGMMTHGSVVAREYGIPAVVGVHAATSRLKTGQRIRVDGSTGKIIILNPISKGVSHV